MKLRALLLAQLLVPTQALAIEPVGPTTTVLEDDGSVVRFPDLAHDPTRDVWLVVSGQNGVRGRFLDGAGAPLGAAFAVAAGGFSPRASHAPMLDGFLVCWLDELATSVECRGVKPGASGVPEFTGDEVPIDEPGSVEHLESAPDLSCAADQCLVSWADVVTGLEIRARRLGPTLAPAGPVMTLSSAPGFDGFPTVDLVVPRNEWVVAWTTEPVENEQTVALARIPVGSDAPLGPAIDFYANDGLNNYPEIACDPLSGSCLCVTYWSDTGPDVWGRRLGASGDPEGDAFAVAATVGFEGGDGLGLAFNTSTASWLAVFQGPETPGEIQQVFGSEISLDGTTSPLQPFQVTSADGTAGVYQPRAAARTGAPEFLVATSVDYTQVGVQRVLGEAIASPGDAGKDSGAQDSGSSNVPRGGTEAGDEGCGCRVGGGRGFDGWWLALGALFLLGVIRFRHVLGRRSALDSPGCAQRDVHRRSGLQRVD